MSEAGLEPELLLVVDVGNTQTHVGVFVPGTHTLAADWRFATTRAATADELAVLLAGLLALRGRSLAQARSSIVSRISGYMTVEKPPVAITRAWSPSSARSRLTMPST